MKRTNEEILKDQGMEQIDIYDVIYPDRKGENKNEKYISRSEQSLIRTDGTSER